MNAKVSFHGYIVPLFGVGENECLEQCKDCSEFYDFLQVRLSESGEFICDKCLTRPAKIAGFG